MAAVGLGLDVVAVEGACERSSQILLLSPEQLGWTNLATELNESSRPAGDKWRILQAFARFCRRMHDKGLYQPDQGLGRFQVRLRPTSQDFQLEDLEGVRLIDPLPDERREEMLGALMASYRDGATNGMRFLRAYVESDEVARQVAPYVIKDLRQRLRPPKPKKKTRKKTKTRVGKLALDPFDVMYVKKGGGHGIHPKELLRLYQDGLKDPKLRVIRSGDARTEWETALESEQEAPIACFTKRRQRAGFVLYRK
jgi:hypothetical protein